MRVLRWRRRLRARVLVVGFEVDVEMRGWSWVFRSVSRDSSEEMEVVRLCWRVSRWERVVSCCVIGVGGVVELGGRNLMVVVVELQLVEEGPFAEGAEILQALRSRERCLRRI